VYVRERAVSRIPKKIEGGFIKRPTLGMPAQGQNAKYSSRVDVFRFASKLRRSSTQSALRICPGRDSCTATKSERNFGSLNANRTTALRRPFQHQVRYLRQLVTLVSHKKARCKSVNVALPSSNRTRAPRQADVRRSQAQAPRR
jgi:hypothetical protein